MSGAFFSCIPLFLGVHIESQRGAGEKKKGNKMIRNISDNFGDAIDFQTVREMENAIISCGYEIPDGGLIDGVHYEVVRQPVKKSQIARVLTKIERDVQNDECIAYLNTDLDYVMGRPGCQPGHTMAIGRDDIQEYDTGIMELVVGFLRSYEIDVDDDWTITGQDAIDYKKIHPLAKLNKRTDPIEGERFDVSIEYAESVIAEDPSLIYCEIGD